ncbi:exodeoxyribonuclease V subunit beta [Lampropedia cohaerens]|uniref:exodeoxyribonuclease V subunit beta n=1 Tax=Lampropedia cohaerens TaxID=1610491 RepID=UPI00069C1E4B|nr:exodeoxyribonuclease V subunit beta [Lampropedia cohaerens]
MTQPAEAPLPLRLPLRGSRLIEASAGTGKTWTIAALYLRLVLGHGAAAPGEVADAPGAAYHRPLTPTDILVLTFTRAATQELTSRIRQRLTEAAACFRDAGEGDYDALLVQLRQAYTPGEARAHAAWRLETAAQVMDEAAIHTIDAWCWKVLQGYASLTASLGELSLDGDVEALWQAAALDFWRNHVVPLAPAQLEVVQSLWPDGQAWLDASAALRHVQVPAADTAKLQEPLHAVIEQAVQARRQRLAELAQGWQERVEAMRSWLDAQTDKAGPTAKHWDGRRLRASTYGPWLDALQRWATDPQPQIAGWTDAATARLQFEGLRNARKADAPPLAPQDLPTAFAELPALLDALAHLPDVHGAIVTYAGAVTRARWQALKAQQGVMDFDDLLQRVQQALTGQHGQTLRARLLAQYPVAMIDEFQDTSPAQYALFRTLYAPERNDPQHLLLLIGDPKQSIYGFRGADIHSYLQARAATAGRHEALDTNFRSTTAMVAGVNRLFLQAEQRAGAGAFRFRTTDAGGMADPVPFHPVRAQGLPLVLRQPGGQPVPALQLVTQEPALSRADAEDWYAELCAEQIATWLQPATQLVLDAVDGQAEPPRALRPGDIAILVYQRQQAQRLQRALRRRRLHAVYLSDRESVFASGEATDLVHWLMAVAEPGNVPLARTAFATALLATPLPQLQAEVESEAALEAQLELLAHLHAVWQRQGVLPMLRQTIHRLGLAARWLAAADGRGERKLTNVLHLAELLQQASAEHAGEQGLIRYLVQHTHAARQGQGGSLSAEEQTVRLESDAQLIQIVTIHKAKGLQYPVVMVPFATHARFVKDASGEEEGGDDGTTPQSWSDEDRLREDLRLLYVALTRAQYATWVGVPLHKRAGSASVNQLHRTAMGYLLSGGAALADEAWWPALQALADGVATDALHVCHYDATAPVTCTVHQPAQDDEALRLPAADPYRGRIDQTFAIASFSGLVRGALAHESTEDAAALPVATAQPFIWQPEAGPAADEPPETNLPAPQAQRWHALRGGARLGDWMHKVLEWLQGEGWPTTLAAAQRQRVQRMAELAGYGAEAPTLVAWVDQLLQARLPLPVADPTRPSMRWQLPQAEASLAEMEFWLPVEGADAKALDAACRAHLWPGQPRAALAPRQWQGLLMGFADLIVQLQGRYWVLDYKTNRLGMAADDYHAPALQAAMLQHRYDVQAAIYLYALHRHLQARLPHYQPQQHLGGALYWFVRGVEHANAGLLAVPLPPGLLTALDAVLGQTA